MCGKTWQSPCSWLCGVPLIFIHFYLSVVFRSPHLTTTIESRKEIPHASTVIGPNVLVPFHSHRSPALTSLSRDLSTPLKLILIVHKLRFKHWCCHLLEWPFLLQAVFLADLQMYSCNPAPLFCQYEQTLAGFLPGCWFSNEGHWHFGTVLLAACIKMMWTGFCLTNSPTILIQENSAQKHWPAL